RSEEAAATTALPSQRPSVPWLAGALVLGAILGGALVSFFGFLGTPPAGSSHESQVATARPSGPASGAGKPTTEALPAEHLGTPDAFASEPAGSEGPSENATPGGDDPEAASLPAEAAVASDAGTSPAHLEPAADSGPMPDSAAVEAIVRAWATAWADQHVEAYLDSYSRSFIPPDGMTRADWEAQRRTRILRPDWIRLSLGPITSTVLEGGTIHADFDQTYATPTYSDEVRKNLVLTREDGGWKIAEERSE
ncbi:MAG: hypothetical protein OEM62_09720, partial [Acidobacteriota bacterium]|nr:hypothetical protein [Acidobacteriota bacterium]